MGIKLLFKLQTLPWCFHIAGHQIPCKHIHEEHESPPPTIKLIKSDGFVQTYDKPIHAFQLMSEFPKHLICRSDSFYIGQKIPALSESDTLELGQKYFLLPQHVFQNDLSFISVVKLIKPSGLHPFDIQKTPNGSLRIRISEDFISRLVMRSEETDGGDDEVLCTTPQLKKDYSQLVGARLWKPKLETIKESSKEKKRIKNKRKICYTSSFRFRTPKSTKTVSSEHLGGPNSNFNKIVNEETVGPVKKGHYSSPPKANKKIVMSRSRKC